MHVLTIILSLGQKKLAFGKAYTGLEDKLFKISKKKFKLSLMIKELN
jgi:hypothetical protein